MRGEHGRDIGVGKKFCELFAWDTHLAGQRGRVGEAAFARLRAGQRVGAGTADVVLVFGDVGEVRKVAEGAHHEIGLFARQAVQQGFQFDAGGIFVVAMQADRQQADALDDVEDFFAFLVADDRAEQLAEQADVLEQRGVLVHGRIGWDARIGRNSVHSFLSILVV